jgi:HNH endonuclease
MSRTYIPKALRLKIRQTSRNRCGYCLTPEIIVGEELEIEHIIPEAAGGLTIEENLWLACSKCNLHKGDRVEAIDPITGEIQKLFNPRTQNWFDHFEWSSDGDTIIGKTPVGRATVIALSLNRLPLVQSRRLWATHGLHPPTE